MRKCPSTAVVPTEAEQPTALTFAERSGVEITRSTAKCRGTNLDPYPSLLNDSPAPDISLPAHPVLSPFALAFDFSASEVTWLGVPGSVLKKGGR
ncbi:hypothetical protein N7497_000562 [Penicillium chrysogenum]|nr:hypothetical protein N7497_000562 [Penicillium chrysogenum]